MSSLKPRNINPSTVTRNLQSIAEPTGNVYESIAIISRRANQISASMKEEIGVRLRDFNVVSDSLEEIFENREQIELSKYYERMPKASLMAIDEFMSGELTWQHAEVPQPE